MLTIETETTRHDWEIGQIFPGIIISTIKVVYITEAEFKYAVKVGACPLAPESSAQVACTGDAASAAYLAIMHAYLGIGRVRVEPDMPDEIDVLRGENKRIRELLGYLVFKRKV